MRFQTISTYPNRATEITFTQRERHHHIRHLRLPGTYLQRDGARQETNHLLQRGVIQGLLGEGLGER